jgi:serine O-acetyltransferase
MKRGQSRYLPSMVGRFGHRALGRSVARLQWSVKLQKNRPDGKNLAVPCAERDPTLRIECDELVQAARLAYNCRMDWRLEFEEAASPVSDTIADWSREACAAFAWDPGRQLLSALRRYQAAHGQPGSSATALRRAAILRHRFWSAVAGCDIPLNSEIGGGLLLPHPNGVVIHPGVRVGPNCLLLQQVTLGRGGKLPGLPSLAGHVDVGAGAKILGGVTIGAHAKIGANAVVLRDVPAHATAVGVPARIVRR